MHEFMTRFYMAIIFLAAVLGLWDWLEGYDPDTAEDIKDFFRRKKQ